MGRSLRSVIAVSAALALLPAAAAAAPGDTARYILPPGNYGGLPFTNDSTRPASALRRPHAPARKRHGDDINRHFLPENFKPIGQTTTIDTGRPGLRLVYDDYGVPHVYGKTRADVAFGAGWTTARDRRLLILLGRYPARVAVADVPGIDAFGLVTSAQTFVPSPQAEALVTKQIKLIVKEFGAKGRQIIADAQAYADGLNAYAKATGDTQPPATVNDVIAVTGFIGSIFGAGGGGEVSNSELLAKLQKGLGKVRGHKAWDDVMLAEDPEAPTTIRRRFNYPVRTGGRVTGSHDRGPGLGRGHRPARGRGLLGEGQRRGGATAQAGIELPGGRPAALRDRQLARRDGSAARLLLPGDRPADPPPRPRHRRPGRRRARPRDVHPHRAHEELRVEPHVGQPRRPRRVRREALQPERLGGHTRPPTTTCSRASAGR